MMKKQVLFFLCFWCLVMPSLAYECPPFSDFYQDVQNVWHLTQFPLAPPGTYWEPLTQGPLAPTYHEVNSIDVGLTMGTWPKRVQCDYGVDGNVFMGIELHMGAKQYPRILNDAPFESDPPADCFESPERCQFDVS
jgi:hypothetical protein